jgi:hypothetical protein
MAHDKQEIAYIKISEGNLDFTEDEAVLAAQYCVRGYDRSPNYQGHECVVSSVSAQDWSGMVRNMLCALRGKAQRPEIRDTYRIEADDKAKEVLILEPSYVGEPEERWVRYDVFEDALKRQCVTQNTAETVVIEAAVEWQAVWPDKAQQPGRYVDATFALSKAVKAMKAQHARDT